MSIIKANFSSKLTQATFNFLCTIIETNFSQRQSDDHQGWVPSSILTLIFYVQLLKPILLTVNITTKVEYLQLELPLTTTEVNLTNPQSDLSSPETSGGSFQSSKPNLTCPNHP